jgi:thiol-disulfide isomerase/thioredoxin
VKRSAAVLVATVLVITMLFWAGWHNLRARRLAMQQAQENHVTLTPAGSANAEASGDDIDLRGKPAPPFTLATLDGKKVSLSDFKGRPVLVNLWGTWCGPCKEEMPWLQEFRQQYAAQGFEVLGITTDSDDVTKDKITKTVQQVGVTYPILMYGKQIEETYNKVGALPVSFYVDRKGVVVEQVTGVAPVGGKALVEEHIKKLLAGGM